MKTLKTKIQVSFKVKLTDQEIAHLNQTFLMYNLKDFTEFFGKESGTTLYNLIQKFVECD